MQKVDFKEASEGRERGSITHLFEEGMVAVRGSGGEEGRSAREEDEGLKVMTGDIAI